MLSHSSHIIFDFQQRATLIQMVISATVRLATRYVEMSHTTLKVTRALCVPSTIVHSHAEAFYSEHHNKRQSHYLDQMKVATK